ncbi:MAG: hypothetical protein ACRD3O_07975 [Terriglobia bacterium]
MRMPRFSADDSLGRNTELFQSHSAAGDRTPRSAVVPQRTKITTVHCNCSNETNICVCDNGMVLDSWLGQVSFLG